MTDYRPAPAVQRIAADLIPKYHDHLDGARIEYVFRDKAAKKAGKTTFGSARKVTGLNAYLATDGLGEGGTFDADVTFFVIEIAEDCWRILEPHQRIALVDHELCHCAGDFDEETGDLTVNLVGHDLEEFKAVVNRHGLWEPDLEEFAKTLAESEARRGQAVDEEDGGLV